MLSTEEAAGVAAWLDEMAERLREETRRLRADPGDRARIAAVANAAGACRRIADALARGESADAQRRLL